MKRISGAETYHPRSRSRRILCLQGPFRTHVQQKYKVSHSLWTMIQQLSLLLCVATACAETRDMSDYRRMKDGGYEYGFGAFSFEGSRRKSGRPV